MITIIGKAVCYIGGALFAAGIIAAAAAWACFYAAELRAQWKNLIKRWHQ